MCDDDVLSSDDDSDMEAMFAKAAQKTQAARRNNMDDDSSDSSSSDDDDVVGCKRGMGETTTTTAQQKLARFGRERNIRKRNNQRFLRRNSDDSDSDDDDDDNSVAASPKVIDKNAIRVEVITITEGDEENHTVQQQQRASDSRISVLDDDDDDDDDSPSKSSRKTIAELKRQGASKADLDVLRKAQNVLSTLHQADLKSQQENMLLSQQEAIQNHQLLVAEDAARMQRSRPAKITIRASFERDNVHEKTEDTELCIPRSTTFAEVQELFLKENKLDSALSTIFFRFRGNPVQTTQTLAFYEVEAENVIEASVLLSGGIQSMMNKKKRKDTGPLLSLTLRVLVDKKAEECILKMGSKEAFEVLIQKYRDEKGLPKSQTVVLKFDGETLRENQRPVDFDMESEDLIDVEVK